MKTYFVKKASKKNSESIEKFSMSKEELETISGGAVMTIIIGSDGKPIIVISREP